MTEFDAPVSFYKMEGAGNDFVVLDNRERNMSVDKLAELAASMCQRKFGVGADGLLALTQSEDQEADYTMIYRNADGSDAGMCGNGARCMALFAHSLGYDREHNFNVHDHVYHAKVKDDNTVTVSFPMTTSVDELLLDGDNIYQIYTGTEHIVLSVEEPQLRREDELKNKGSTLRYHSRFEPKGTNVNFIFGENDDSLKLQTYERGVENLTLACGTGAIASALVWHHLQNESGGNFSYKVQTDGGLLTVHFSFDDERNLYSNIKLEGPANFVFKGDYLR